MRTSYFYAIGSFILTILVLIYLGFLLGKTGLSVESIGCSFAAVLAMAITVGYGKEAAKYYRYSKS
ncbi:TPA: hypothetical protein OXT18_001755 [Acinetobacter baumannii]|nr:hypothetical protein [Acinetobacter baumannii]